MSGVQITGLIKPLNAGNFPVWEDINGLGGFRAAADATARDAIDPLFRKIGMTVVLQDTGVAYKLTGGVTNGDWQVFGGFNALAGVYFLQDGDSIQDAIDASVTAGLTTAQFLMGPGTYAGFSIAGSVRYSFSALGYAGVSEVNVDSSVAWEIGDDSSISFLGVNVSSSAWSDGAGAGDAQWTFGNGALGTVTGGPFTHNVTISTDGLLLGPSDELSSAATIIGAIAHAGAIYGSNTLFTGNLSCSSFFGSQSVLANIAITAAENSVLKNCESTTSTVHFTNSNRSLFVDESTASFLSQITVTGTNPDVVVYKNPVKVLTGDDGTNAVSTYQIGSADHLIIYVPNLIASTTYLISEVGALDGKRIDIIYADPTGLFNIDVRREVDSQTFNAPYVGDGTSATVVLGGVSGTFNSLGIERLSSHWETADFSSVQGDSDTTANRSTAPGSSVTQALTSLQNYYPRRTNASTITGVLSPGTHDLTPNPAPAGLYQINASLAISSLSISGALAIDAHYTDESGVSQTKRILGPVLTGAFSSDTGLVSAASAGAAVISYELVATTPIVGAVSGKVRVTIQRLFLDGGP